MHRLIISIVVSDKNNHIFLADRSNNFSIIELKESSDFISKLIFSILPMGNVFHFFRNCWGLREKLIFLQKKNLLF